MKKNIAYIIQIINGFIISVCIVLHLFSLGAYELGTYGLEDSEVGIDFKEHKAICVAIVGLILAIALLVQLLYRNKLYLLGAIFILISSGIQSLFIGTEFTNGRYIIDLDINKRFFLTGGIERMQKLLREAQRLPLINTPTHRAQMGLFLFEILSKLISVLTVVAICYIAIWLICFAKKVYDEKNIKFLFCREKKERKPEITKLVCRIVNVVVGIIIFMCIYRYSYETHDMDFIEKLSRKQNVLLGRLYHERSYRL